MGSLAVHPLKCEESLIFPPNPNLQHTINWDGLDVYGRPVRGTVPLEVEITYVYPARYWIISADAPVRQQWVDADSFISWGLGAGFTEGELEAAYPARNLTERTLRTSWKGSIGAMLPSMSSWDVRGLGLGGWMVDVHHSYDPTSRTLILGSGELRRGSTLFGAALGEVARTRNTYGSGQACSVPAGCCNLLGCPDDGALAATADMGRIFDVLSMPDGSLLVASGYPDRLTNPVQLSVVVRRIAVDGRISTLRGFAANQPIIGRPAGSQSAKLALGTDGTLYVATSGVPSAMVHRLDFVGTDQVTPVKLAGGNPAIAAEGLPAVDAALGSPGSAACGNCMGTVGGLVATPDGTLYVSTQSLTHSVAHVVRRIGTDGIINTVAGTGVPGFSGDGGLALEAQLRKPGGLAMSPSGDLLIADSENFRVRKVGVDGIVSTVAGNGGGCNDTSCGDGAKATLAGFPFEPTDVVAVGERSFYVAGGRTVRFVDPSGFIRTVVGTLRDCCTPQQSAALDAFIGSSDNAHSIDLTPTGDIVLENDVRVFRVAPQFPGTGTQQLVIPSDDRQELFRFAPNGKHLDTIDTATGATLFAFGYDSFGQLSSVSDRAGNQTIIERDGSGAPTRILGPFGQATTLALNANGYLESAVGPGGITRDFTYSAGGLMETMVDERGGLHQFEYDNVGRLLSDLAPDGASKALDLDESDGFRTVTVTQAAGTQATYSSELSVTGQLLRTKSSGGLSDVSYVDGSGRQVLNRADGMQTSTFHAPDPRFGMLAPYVSSRVETTPGGTTNTLSRTRTFSGLNVGFSEFLQLNSRTTTTTYNAATKTYTTTTPTGRRMQRTLDALGRLSTVTIDGLHPLQIFYDSRGRTSSVQTAERLSTIAYVASGSRAGYLEAMTDPVNTVTNYDTDELGRVTAVTEGGTTAVFDWDEASNLVAVTPPGRPVHAVSYTAGNQVSSYDPPSAGLPVSSTTYEYDAERRLRIETRPDGTQIHHTPDSAGRPDTVQIPGGTIDYDYYPLGLSGSGKASDVSGPYNVDVHLTYDGRLATGATWSGDVNGTIGWQYDSDFAKTREAVSGQVGSSFATFEYDADRLLTCASWSSCSGSSSVSALRLSRSPLNGIITGIALGSTSETITGDAFGGLSRQLVQFGGSPVLDITYDAIGAERDRLGRIVQKTEVIADTTRVFRYGYDALRRLIDVSVDGVLDEHFDYDANGNRISGFKAGEGTVSAAYDEQDRLSSYGPFDYTYGANGELSTKTNRQTSDVWLYQYDALGNLLSVRLPSGELVEYLVDGLGRRVGKKLALLTL